MHLYQCQPVQIHTPLSTHTSAQSKCQPIQVQQRTTLVINNTDGMGMPFPYMHVHGIIFANVYMHAVVVDNCDGDVDTC